MIFICFHGFQILDGFQGNWPGWRFLVSLLAKSITQPKDAFGFLGLYPSKKPRKQKAEGTPICSRNPKQTDKGPFNKAKIVEKQTQENVSLLIQELSVFGSLSHADSSNEGSCSEVFGCEEKQATSQISISTNDWLTTLLSFNVDPFFKASLTKSC